MDSETNNTCTNAFRFPDCWEDDLRMVALFAPFRSKNLNPNDWSSKMTFWTSLIQSWCTHYKCPVIKISIMKKEFSRKGVEPACLEDVLKSLYSAGIIVLEEEFFDLCENWREWIAKKFVTNPLKRTFHAIKFAILGQNETKEDEYVHLSVVENLSQQLLKEIPPPFQGKLIELDSLMTLWKIKESKNLLLALLWLQKQEKAMIHKKNGCVLVKFPENGKKLIKINETDLGIFNLEKQQKDLKIIIDRLEKDKNIALQETKKHLNDNKKYLASVSLKRKKELEKNIEKKNAVLENIEGLLQRIDQAKLDGNVFDCYQTGIIVLDKILKESGLNEESVTSTMEALDDVLRSSTKASESLSISLDVPGERSLEDELNDLLLDDLPNVPNTNLGLHSDDKNKEKKSKKSKKEAISVE